MEYAARGDNDYFVNCLNHRRAFRQFRAESLAIARAFRNQSSAKNQLP